MSFCAKSILALHDSEFLITENMLLLLLTLYIPICSFVLRGFIESSRSEPAVCFPEAALLAAVSCRNFS